MNEKILRMNGSQGERAANANNAEKKDVLLDYTFVLDASSSMVGDIPEVLVEVNKQLMALKKTFELTGRPCRVTIVKFDNSYTVLRENERIEKLDLIKKSEYFASGATALYDAFGISVKRTDARVDFKVRRGEAEALVVVFTDGGENASSEYNGKMISELFMDYQDRVGWEIVLIGTDISALRDMGSRNMNVSYMLAYDQNQKVEAMQNLTESVNNFYAAYDFNLDLNKKMKYESVSTEINNSSDDFFRINKY